MQPISLIVAALLGLAALAFVLYPLYRRSSVAQVPLAETRGPLPNEREQIARQALREVEFDFQLGNLDEKEYRALRTRYLNRAATEMKNRHQEEKELDEQIEAELRRLKEAKNQEMARNEEDHRQEEEVDEDTR